MNLATLTLLCCPACAAALAPDSAPLVRHAPGPLPVPGRLRDGVVICPACAAWYPVDGGLLDLRVADGQDQARRARLAAACGMPGEPPATATADAHKQQQERFFTEEAEGYERDVVDSPFYRALDGLTVRRWGRGLPPASRVLEIGAGTGRVAVRLAAAGHHVIALDLTGALLRRAQEKARALGVGAHVDFVVGDAERLPVRDGVLDAVAVHGVLHHVMRPDVVIAEGARALKPGGAWFSLDPHRSPLRGLFDAAMRVVPLWQEEAAPDGLQSEVRLRGWLEAAGLTPRFGYSVYVLPHLLAPFPERVARLMLGVTDRLGSRSVLRPLAGVIYAVARKEPEPAAVRGRRLAWLRRAALLAAIALLSGVWQTDPDVAVHSQSYYMGGLGQTLEVANAPATLHVAMVDADGAPLEDGLDDIGYALGLQLWSLAGVTLTGPNVAALHAWLFVIGAVLFAWAVAMRFDSTAAGAAVLIVMLALGTRLSMLIYGQVSNQTITSVFPPFVLAALIGWTAMLGRRGRGWSLFGATVIVGALAGWIDLVRHSHGLALMLALGLVVAFGLRGLRPRAAVAAALAIGYLVVAVLMPAALKVHRDVGLGRYHGFTRTYLERPPSHHIYYTLLTAIGRYPNPLDLHYEDRSVDRYIDARAFGGREESPSKRVEASAPLFREYVRTHRRDYALMLLRGAGELPPFIAYTTFIAEQKWEYAWPAIAPGLTVNPRDRARYGENLLMNVRWRYVQLGPLEWIVYGAAWLVIVAAAVSALATAWGRPRSSALLPASALVYLAWVGVPRALVPVQGMDLIFAFWAVALLCAAYLALQYPPNPAGAQGR